MDSVPTAITARPQWVTWDYQNGTKVPFDAHNGKHASSTNPLTWAKFGDALRAQLARHHAGVGYVFSKDDPYTGVDLDDCIADDGTITAWAYEIVQSLKSYTEISPSGHGLKIWVEGAVPGSVKTAQIEIYSERRYFTVTGRHLDGTPTVIRTAQAELTTLYEQLKPRKEPTPQTFTTAPLDDAYLRAWADRVIDSATARMRDAGNGARHNTRVAMGRLLGGLIGHGLMTEDRAERLIYDANIPDKNTDAERRAIKEGVALGRSSPLDLPPPPPQPVLDDERFACCPDHKRRLVRGKRRGWYCSAPDKSTPSGWCNFWWAGDNYTEPPASSVVQSSEAPGAVATRPAHSLAPLLASDLLLMNIAAPRQFVPGLIREGLSFFIGQPGVGKTPALIQLAIALSTGGLWLGAFRVPKIRVAYIGPEYDAGDVRSIIIASTGGHIALKDLLIFTVENFTGPASEEEAMMMIDDLVRIYQVEAIIIDLFTGFLPPEKFKQNAYRGDYREFLAYHRAALRHHIMLTGAWHGTKRDANPATMYNGGQGFWGAAGGGRMVMYQDEEEQIRLYAQLRGTRPVTYTVSESHTAGRHTWAVLEGADPEPAFGSEVHRAVYRAVKEHATAAGLTSKVIYGLVRPDLTTNTSEAYIRKCVSVLTKRGIFTSIGDSYRLARAGIRGATGTEGTRGTEGTEDEKSVPSVPLLYPDLYPPDSASESPKPDAVPLVPPISVYPEVLDAGVPKDHDYSEASKGIFKRLSARERGENTE